MSRTIYGSVSARFEEGRNYNVDKLIHEGDDITMYYWSDQHCYYVTRVESQQSIFVKQYHVCADHSQPGGCGHQNWLYFKTAKEEAEYLNKHCPNTYRDDLPEDEEENWVYRNNSWKQKLTYTLEIIREICKENYWDVEKYLQYKFTPKEVAKLREGKEVYKYRKLNGKISFGVRNYYYDWSF